MAKINSKKEWQFLEECERKTGLGICAKQRFLEILKITNRLPEPKKILDVGGTRGTALWLESKFPQAKVTILNQSARDASSDFEFIKADAQNFKTRQKFDLIFALEILEHLYNPDGLIASCLLALNPGGHLIICTPNLSCLANRLFLLAGWTPGNYSPSLRFFTGNPFFAPKITDFGDVGDHKSVFTWKGLIELAGKYGLKTVAGRGYSYGQKEEIQIVKNPHLSPPLWRFRLILNRFLPQSLREGMVFALKSPRKINQEKVNEGILKKALWEF